MSVLASLRRPMLIRRVRRVDVFVHWSVFGVGIVALLGNLRRPLVVVSGFAAYFGVLLIHEIGHLALARRLGYMPFKIELYPILGLAFCEKPESRFDKAAIAWGGALAQAVVGVPVVLCLAVTGYTPLESINIALAIAGSFSLALAAFNLLPFPRLDGSKAWDLIPAFFEGRRIRRSRRPTPYRSSR